MFIYIGKIHNFRGDPRDVSAKNNVTDRCMADWGGAEVWRAPRAGFVIGSHYSLSITCKKFVLVLFR